MSKMIITLSLWLLCQIASAAIPEKPDVTILANDPAELYQYGAYLIGKNSKGLIAYRFDDIDSLYHYENIFYKNISSEKIKIFDSLLVYKANNDQLHFVNLSHLPQFEYLGFVDFNQEFADYVLKDNRLYLSMYFNGIAKYQLNSFTSAVFVDSSMTGIMVTQLEEQNDTLYVLDEYNGLLRYDIAAPDFGQLIDYMFIPFRVKSFIKNDSLYYLNLNDKKLFKGKFENPGEVIIDSVEVSSDINKIDLYMDNLLLFSSRSVSLLDKTTLAIANVLNIENYQPTGVTLDIGDAGYLLLPSLTGGVEALSLDLNTAPSQVLYYGNFSDYSVYNNSLFVSAKDNPVVVYDINDQLDVTENYKIYETFSNSYKMTSNGDSLIVIYPNLNETAFIYASSDPDFYFLENSFALEDKTYYELYFQKQLTYNYNLLLMDLYNGFDVYSISSTGLIAHQLEWPEIEYKTSFTLLGDKVVTSDGVANLSFYNILPDFSLEHFYDLNLGNRPLETIMHENYLYAFDAARMYKILLTPDTPYVVEAQLNLPYAIVASDIEANKLIGVGAGGMVEIDLSVPIPELVSWGGLGGNKVMLSNGIAITSNGFDLTLYYLDHVTGIPEHKDHLLPDEIQLVQNYPNPFNLETVLSFNLPKGGEVELSIYNILGQKVRQLVASNLPAGGHTYIWDGKNENGGTVATGLYFYRLVVDDYQATKKMMLVK